MMQTHSQVYMHVYKKHSLFMCSSSLHVLIKKVSACMQSGTACMQSGAACMQSGAACMHGWIAFPDSMNGLNLGGTGCGS